jgi:hypothetical protein
MRMNISDMNMVKDSVRWPETGFYVETFRMRAIHLTRFSSFRVFSRELHCHCNLLGLLTQLVLLLQYGHTNWNRPGYMLRMPSVWSRYRAWMLKPEPGPAWRVVWDYCREILVHFRAWNKPELSIVECSRSAAVRNEFRSAGQHLRCTRHIWAARNCTFLVTAVTLL